MVVKRSIARAVVILACGLLLLAPTGSIAQRDMDVLSYETGVSKKFLEQFEEAAGRLNIGPAESRRIILTLSGVLKDLNPGGWAYTRLSSMGEKGSLFATQLMSLRDQHGVGTAISAVLKQMQEAGPAGRRSLAETFHIPVRMALLSFIDGKTYSELDLLSYETGLSKQFLEEFQKAAENLNVGPKESLPIIVTLSGGLTDFLWWGPARRRLSIAPNAQKWIDEIIRHMEARDVQGAVEDVFKVMQLSSLAGRRYIAQTFQIPESAALIYDELQELRKGTTDKGTTDKGTTDTGTTVSTNCDPFQEGCVQPFPFPYLRPPRQQ